MRPKKTIEDLRVPLNCLIAPVTKEALTGMQNDTKESQGEVIDRAVALLAFGEEVNPPLHPRTATPEQLERIRRNVTARRPMREKGDKTR